MSVKNGKKIRDILAHIEEERWRLVDEQERWIKKFMEDRGITLFDLLVNYEFKTEDHYPGIDTFDTFNIDNTYVVMSTDYGFRKRTPEEREEFIKKLGVQIECDCGHYRMVHSTNFNVVTDCLEPQCSCTLFVTKEVSVENLDHGEQVLG